MGNTQHSSGKTSAISNEKADDLCYPSAATNPGIKYSRKHAPIPDEVTINRLKPLRIVRDVGCDPIPNASFKAKREPVQSHYKFSSLIVYAFAAYVALCIIVLTSGTAQSLFVYLHFLRWPLGDLTDLESMGLPEARNFVVTTEDGYRLYGWHLMNPAMNRMHARKGEVCPWGTTLAKEKITHMMESSEFSPVSVSQNCFDMSIASAERIVVLFHGNGGTRGLNMRVRTAQQVAAQLNAHVVAFDYRGFGDSEGWPSEEGTKRDSRAIIGWINKAISRGRALSPSSSCTGADIDEPAGSLQQLAVYNNGLPPTRPGPRLYLYGHSLGSGVSAALAEEMNLAQSGSVSGLILDSAFTSMSEAALSHPVAAIFRVFPILKSFMLKFLRYRYAILDRIPSLVGDARTPLLILHGAADSKIPISHADRLYQKALQTVRNACPASGNGTDSEGRGTSRECRRAIPPVAFHTIERANHNDCYKYATWLKAISQFVLDAEVFFSEKERADEM